MNKLCIVAILIALNFIIKSPASASCAPPGTTADNSARSDIVVTGTISKSYDTYALLDVATYYKGSGPDLLKVSGRISPSSVSSVDLELTEGSDYLLFLKGQTKDILRANACDGSRLLNSGLSSDEQNSLGSGATPSAKPVSQAKSVNPTDLALAGGTLVGLLLYLLKVRKII